mmetsp:Transcript_26924/g.60198  ORF Transcript_26924/g.60198 Transcript_26924/m.60198 type:complete len:418 (-) Transcript_26924:454-1707(-)
MSDSESDDYSILCGVNFATIVPGEVQDDEEVLAEAASKARAKAEKKEEARREVRARREAVADVLLKHSRRPIQLAPPYRRRPVGLADMEQLFAWAESQGASIDNVAWGHDPWGGSGLFVKKRPILAGNTVLTLPRCLRVGKEFVTTDRGHLPVMLPPDCPDLSALAILLLAWLPGSDDLQGPLGEENPLLDSNSCGTGSAGGGDSQSNTAAAAENVFGPSEGWELYAKCLPTADELSNAVVMSPERAAAWANCPEHGSRFTESIGGMRRRADHCVRYILEELAGGFISSGTASTCGEGRQVLTSEEAGVADSSVEERRAPSEAEEEAVRWAIAMVVSRSHGLGTRTGRWLTPILDLANHKPESEGGGRLAVDSQGGLTFRNGSEHLPVGHQIFLDYQIDDDEELVAAYGFSLKANVG